MPPSDMPDRSIPLKSKLFPHELLLFKLKLFFFINESKLMLFLFIIVLIGTAEDLPGLLGIEDGVVTGKVAGVGGNDVLTLRSSSSSLSLSWFSTFFLEEYTGSDDVKCARRALCLGDRAWGGLFFTARFNMTFLRVLRRQTKLRTRETKHKG